MWGRQNNLMGALLLAVSMITTSMAWTTMTTTSQLCRYAHVRPLAAARQNEICMAGNDDDNKDKRECKNSDVSAPVVPRAMEESRRSMLHRSLLGTVTLASWMTLGGASAQAGDETSSSGSSSGSSNPLAELDAIAAQIGRSSNYPNSISPLPTLKQTELELVRYNTPPPATTTTPSDLSQALQESQRRKNIEPRTHG